MNRIREITLDLSKEIETVIVIIISYNARILIKYDRNFKNN